MARPRFEGKLEMAVALPILCGRAQVRDGGVDLETLRRRLAESRASWVPVVAPAAVWDKSSRGWRLGNISGDAGKSMLIYSNPEHRTHVDFDGENWKGDDLDLIRCL